MESSFFEYRDATAVEDESDTEIIDNSLIDDQSFSTTKKPGIKNHTLYIAESEDDTDEDAKDRRFLSVSVTRSSVEATTLISSSDDDKRGCIRSQSATSNKELACSSDEELSPEIVPRRRPNNAQRRSSLLFIGRKNRKRMILTDSDTENSIIIEHDKNRKHACLKDTPAKINSRILAKAIADGTKKADDSCHNSCDTGDDQVESGNVSKNSSDDEEENIPQKADMSHCSKEFSENSSDEHVDCDKESHNVSSSDRKQSDIRESSGEVCNNEKPKSDASEYSEADESDELDEDQMVMSRATRMSIMGFVPKESPSDESDFIQSDDNSNSRPNSANSLTDLPDVSVSLHKTPEKLNNEDDDINESRISCSPFSSPLKDITNNFNESFKIDDKNKSNRVQNNNDIICDLTQNDSFETYDLTRSESNYLSNKVFNRMTGSGSSYNEKVIDEDLTIIDAKPEIIALSSDDEDEVKEEKKSLKVEKSSTKKEDTSASKTQRVGSDMKQFLLPPSYPNQVVYVQKHVRENELAKLNGLQEDLHNIRHLLETMDVDTLPDRGVKLIERLTALELEVKRQGDKVANMVVEPDNPTLKDVAQDGFNGGENKGLSWDDIQKASNAVQPRMFGKQAMATHMAERNLILERLRDLHESLASRPPENEFAENPAALKTQLMPHQLHALAWLRWRETQRPAGGILADDMGLGKTITMIALIAIEKESDMDDDDDEYDDHTGKNSSKLIRGGTLVVCPASLMQQWAGEVAQHCRPHAVSVCQHHGAARAQQPHRLATYDLVLTTYNILLRETEKGGALCRVRWRRVVLDEAHAVRNHKSLTAAAVLPRSLRAFRRWALTGTPMHNRDLDLFALLRFLGCSPFDDLQMWKKWIDNKSLGGQERLSTIMRCVMLRRTKQQLQERGQLACLPPRDVHERTVTLARDELNVYQKLLVFSKTLFAQFLHQRAEKRADAEGFLPSGKDSAYAEMHKKMIKLQGAKPVKSHEILVLLLRLRQVCCHCSLIAAILNDDDTTGEQLETDNAENDLLDELNKLVLEDKKNTKRKSGEGEKEKKKEKEEEDEEGTTAAEAVRSVLSRTNPVFDLERRSSKISAVMDCLNENVFPNEGEKAVVVSQWTGVLRLVERELKRAGVQCVTLSGDVPVNARAPLVRALNDPASPVRTKRFEYEVVFAGYVTVAVGWRRGTEPVRRQPPAAAGPALEPTAGAAGAGPRVPRRPGAPRAYLQVGTRTAAAAAGPALEPTAGAAGAGPRVPRRPGAPRAYYRLVPALLLLRSALEPTLQQQAQGRVYGVCQARHAHIYRLLPALLLLPLLDPHCNPQLEQRAQYLHSHTRDVVPFVLAATTKMPALEATP
ncbi:unnamed protein product [Parnassius apollo]|uniref:(apollo) hypothetical protein n=1 Tax=Parnassius apollo TaxID=110799 RepID=A0A8S3X8D2_PARAO|nr:unnamed protein product [Parnassius apollo]